MTDKSKETLQPTDEQVDRIILHPIQGLALQCAGYIHELQCPHKFIAVMLKDFTDAFKSPLPDGEGGCDCS